MGNIANRGTPSSPAAPAAAENAASPANAAPVTNPQSPTPPIIPPSPAVPAVPVAPKAPPIPPPVSNPAAAQTPSNPSNPTTPSNPTAPSLPSGSGINLGGYRRKRRRKKKTRKKKTQRKKTQRKKTRRKKTHKKRPKITKGELLKQINNFVSRDDFHTWSNKQMDTTLISILKNIKLLKLEKNEKVKYFIDFIIDLGADQRNAKINKLYNEIAAAYFRKPRRKTRRRHHRRRGGWFGNNWFGTWGQKTKKRRFGWTSKGMKCNPYLPLQCPGGGRCIGRGWGIAGIQLQGKCI